MAIVLGAIGYWIIEDHYRAMHFLERVWPSIAVPIAAGLPLLMFLLRLSMPGRASRAS